MRDLILFVICCALAGIAPFLKPERTALPLSDREQRFVSGFPGRIARFTDGKREIIVRWVTRETRMLHPAADCFRGMGYAIRPLPIYIDERGRHWGSFTD